MRAAIVAPATGGELEATLGSLTAEGYEVGESTLVRAPAGFSADAPRVELLRFTVMHAIKKTEPVPPEFYSDAFVEWCMEGFAGARPLVEWLVDNVG